MYIFGLVQDKMNNNSESCGEVQDKNEKIIVIESTTIKDYHNKIYNSIS